MSDGVELFAVTDEGPRPLPVAPQVKTIHEMLDGLPLGVYSALRTFEHNKFLWLEAHLDRTDRSMALLGWSYRLDRPRLRQALHQVCTAYPLPEARVRFDVLAAPAAAGDQASRELICLSPFQPLPADYYLKGVHVDLAPGLHRERPLIKTAAFVVQRRPYPLGHRLAFEHLLLDEGDHILEGSSSNFYGLRHGELWTADQAILEGITRRIVLQLAQAAAIPRRLEALSVAEIGQLDEAFVSSSSRGLVPVVQVAQQVIGDGRPGPVTRRLMQQYADFVAREIRPAV
jgi:branched-chain amino acid aminotransferase